MRYFEEFDECGSKKNIEDNYAEAWGSRMDKSSAKAGIIEKIARIDNPVKIIDFMLRGRPVIR